MTKTGGASSMQPANVLLVGQWLARYASVLAELTETPVAVRHLTCAPDQEDEIAPFLPGTTVLVTNIFSTRLGAEAADLRLIQLPGSGYDRIDLDAVPSTTRVAVCYEHQRGIAEYVLMSAMAVSRRLIDHDRRLRTGDWSMSMIAGDVPARELGGRTIGVIGYGRIGREVGRLARQFGMRVIALTRNELTVSDGADPDVRLRPEELPTLLGESDIIVIALPLSDATRGMIGAAEFAQMKHDAILINPARGPIVDEEALYDALATRRIAGAAIDVWYQYPAMGSEPVLPSRFPMHELDNLIMTPHVSGYTDGMARGRLREIAANIDRLARGEPLRNRVDHNRQLA